MVEARVCSVGWLLSVLLLIGPHAAVALRRPFLSDASHAQSSQPVQLAVTSSLMDAILPSESNTVAAKNLRQLHHVEEDACQQYLLKYQAVRDRSALSTVFLNRNIELALHARRASDWASGVPWPIFLEYVLPFASLTERREGWRRLFFQELLPQVGGAGSLTEAAVALNDFVWSRWNIQLTTGQQPNIMSPFEVIKAGEASATGLSIFLVNALRAVGIPARIVGVPQWRTAPSEGSHTWVEMWDRGAWSWLQPGQVRSLNDTWFFPSPAKDQVVGSTRFGIYALTSACDEASSDASGQPALWAPEEKGLCSQDITQAYLDAQPSAASTRRSQA